MIRWSNLLHLLGFFTLGLSVGLLGCVCFALANGDEGLTPLAASLAIGVNAGVLLILVFRLHFRALSRREGLLLVVATWLIAALLGALPFYFSPHFPSLADSVFESVSGFSTTGATVLADVEALPASLLLWRSLTHWLGGMGIILLGIAILPLIGAGGRELYRAEFSGARSERLRPRIAETAVALWKLYTAFTLASYVALRLAGMEWGNSTLCATPFPPWPRAVSPRVTEASKPLAILSWKSSSWSSWSWPASISPGTTACWWNAGSLPSGETWNCACI